MLLRAIISVAILGRTVTELVSKVGREQLRFSSKIKFAHYLLDLSCKWDDKLFVYKLKVSVHV